MERASSVWCRTFLPSGRAGAGWDSRFRSLSHWSATMESSTPPPSPSPTPLNQGPGPTALLLELSCGHIAPLHRHQHLHPLHHPRWGGSRMAMGLTTVLMRACRCCHSTTWPVWVLFVICMCALSDCEKLCACALQRGSWTCEYLHTCCRLGSPSSESKLWWSGVLKRHG